MSENKTYYWLKLKENFFEDDTQVFLENQENGEKICLFYLKLCLKALKDDGRLIRYIGSTLMPYDTEGLAMLTRTDLQIVQQALPLFTSIGLVEKLETGELYLSQIQEMTGGETGAAERMRKHRARQNLLQKCNNVTHDRNNVTQNCNNVQKCYTEKEKERETEKEKEFRVESVEDTAAALNSLNFSFDENSIERIARNLKDRELNIDYLSFVATRLKDKSIKGKCYNGMTQSEKQGVFFKAVTEWNNYAEDYRNGETPSGRIDNDEIKAEGFDIPF